MSNVKLVMVLASEERVVARLTKDSKTLPLLTYQIPIDTFSILLQSLVPSSSKVNHGTKFQKQFLL